MGTIGNQPHRSTFFYSDESFKQFLRELSEFLRHSEFDARDVLLAYIFVELNRANNIAVQDGNFRDEHAAGIGEILNNIDITLSSIKESLNNDSLD